MSKNIIYIGDFVEKFSTERYIAKGFEELGHAVTWVQENQLRVVKADALLVDILKLKPDLVLFSKGRPLGESELLIEMLKKQGIKTAVWLFDLYFDLPVDRKFKLEQKVAPFNSEIIFSTDGGHQKEFEALDINHKLLRQGIYEPEAILYDREKVNDIIFVGGDIYKTRVMMLEGLYERYGKRFKRFGTPDKIVRGLPLNELYASTKVVVGDSQPSPRYWSNRIYETLGRGGFLIHPMVEGLDEEFEIGKHLVTFPYGDNDKLFELVDYYLEHDEEREKIRKAGFEYVKKNYTYTKRCEQLLKILWTNDKQ